MGILKRPCPADAVSMAEGSLGASCDKKVVVTQLSCLPRENGRGLPFIDTGIGLEHTDRGLTGAVRVTTGTPDMREHVQASSRIPMDAAGIDLYGSRAQVSDMNMLAAALTVIGFKKHYGFYLDLEREYHSVFQMDGAQLINDDRQGAEG